MSWPRAIYILTSVVISVAIGYFFGHHLRVSGSAVGSIIDTLAIFAAVLVAVISIIGDPSMLLPGNWRVGYTHAQDIQRRIARFSFLFLVYVITLIISIVAIVCKDSEFEHVDLVFSVLAMFATLSFLLSLPLPFVLMGIQKDRMDEVVRSRKDIH